MNIFIKMIGTTTSIHEDGWCRAPLFLVGAEQFLNQQRANSCIYRQNKVQILVTTLAGLAGGFYFRLGTM